MPENVSPASLAKARLPGLDALRAFSILWVIASHLDARDHLLPPGMLQLFAGNGIIGVVVFFTISGFLITTLLLDEEDRHGRIGLGGFYTRRAFRILPAALVYLLVALGIRYWAALEWNPSEWLGAAFFYRNLVSGINSGLTGHFWSLSVEEQFYFAWPLMLVVAPRRHRLWMTAALCVLAPVWRHLVTKMMVGQEFHIGRIDMNYDSLMMGALLALGQRHPACRSYLDRRGLAGVVLVVAVAVFLWQVWWDFPPGLVRVFVGPSLRLVCIAAVIKVLTEGRCAPVQAVCEWGPIVWIGRISYSLYLWQTLFCSLALPYFAWRTPGCLLVLLACSAASYYLVEQPMLRLRGRLQKG